MRTQTPSTHQEPDLKVLARLGEAFGEPTRVRVYGLLASTRAPCSAGELAQALGLHRTVVRAHLERMVELGFLVSGVRHTGLGGRPAKIYAVAADSAVPERRDRWVADAALGLVGAMAEDSHVSAHDLIAALEAAGEAQGIALRQTLTVTVEADGKRQVRGNQQAMLAAGRHAALGWLAAAGYQPEPGSGGIADVTLNACAFAELHARHGRLVCAFDRGLLCGLFGVAAEEARLRPREGGEACRLEPVDQSAPVDPVAMGAGVPI